MAAQNINTLTLNVSLDDLEGAFTRIRYATGLAGLLTEQRDFHKLPIHQQQAIHSLLCFTHEAENAISAMIHSND